MLPGLVQARDQLGLVEVECWFEADLNMPDTHCYRMHVPENHSDSDSKSISIPVVVFRAGFSLWNRSPVIHLGGGGPGAPMYLDDDLSMRYFWEYHDEISTQQGRDLIVIDPRGTGLAEPLLACHSYLENEAGRLERNLSMLEEWQEIEQDYQICIDEYVALGVDFSKYNSLAVARDVESLRKALGIESWHLIGVSYGTIYAQMLAREYPQSIDSMILDSATFPNLQQAKYWLKVQSEPVEALLNYCHIDSICDKPLPEFETRFWNLYRRLNLYPLRVELNHPYRPEQISLVLNGDRMLEALLQGTYSMEIYYDLPAILTELEQDHSKSLQPYLEGMLLYLFDEDWGDVSAEAHYCFDTRPWVDFEELKSKVSRLSEGYVKSSLEMGLSATDFCPRMGIEAGYPPMASGARIDVPTLFLHGRFDSVTFLDDVIAQRSFFPRSHLIEYNQAHSVLSYEACAEITAARYVKNPDIERSDLDCN